MVSVDNSGALVNGNRKGNRSFYWDVVDLIIDGIRQHKYRPGDRLPTEIELMEQSGLSRGSVREAIKVLSTMGLVDIIRGDGTYVSDAQNVMGIESITYTLLMNNTSKKMVIEFRNSLEDMLYRLVAKKITPEEIEKLEANIEESEKAYAQRNIKRLVELDCEFHMMIITFSHNIFLEKQLRGVYEFFTEEFLSKNFYTKEEFESSMETHRGTILYFKTKDIKYLEENMKRSTIWELT